MATYRVEQPDGSVYQVETPETAPSASIGAPQSMTARDFFPMTSRSMLPFKPTAAVLDLASLAQKAGLDVPLAQARRIAESRPMLPFPQALQTELRGGEQRLAESGRVSEPGRFSLEDVMKVIGQTAMLTPSPAATARVAEGAGQIATELAQTIKPRIPDVFKPLKVLTGNQEAIATTDKLLDQSLHQYVKQFRSGGSLNDKVLNMLHTESAAAWAPMKEVTASIPGTIGIDEVRQAVATRLVNQPERLQAVNLFLDNLASTKAYTLPTSGRPFTFTASDWSDLSSELGGFLRRANIKGKVASSFSELVNTDLRSAIGDLLELKAPEALKPNVQLAKTNWANYAADRDRLFQLFAPGGSPQLPTTAGRNFLKQAALNRLAPDDQEFLQRLQATSGFALPKEIYQIAKTMQRQQTLGRIGTKARQLLPAATALGIGEEVWRRH